MTTESVAVPSFRRAAGGAAARLDPVMWMLLAVTAAFAVVATLDLVDLARVLAALPVPDVRQLRAGEGLGLAEMVLFFALLGAYLVWFVMTAYVVRGLHEDPNAVLRTTPMTLWQVGMGVTVVTSVLLPHADLMNVSGFELRLRWMVPIVAARLVLSALLVIVVFGLRRRVYAALLRSTVAPLPLPSQRPMTLLDISRNAAAITPPLPIAGDAWWAEVADRVAAAGTALPLLESAGPDDGEWLVVAPGADLAALRATLRPGATLTLLSRPPAAGAPPQLDDPEALTAVVPH